MSHNLRLAQMLAATAMLVEASGPVCVKEYRSASVLDEIRHAEEARRERNRQRLAREQAEAAAQRALTPDHVWARIERDEKRRADKKAAKKAKKQA